MSEVNMPVIISAIADGQLAAQYRQVGLGK
jgi:hypothetical protein